MLPSLESIHISPTVLPEADGASFCLKIAALPDITLFAESNPSCNVADEALIDADNAALEADTPVAMEPDTVSTLPVT